MRLEKDRRPVAQREVAARVARLVDQRLEALGRIEPVDEADIRALAVARGFDGGQNRRKVLSQPAVEREGEERRLRHGPGDHPVEIDAIGDVGVDEQMRLPGVHQPHQIPRLGRRELQEVAVQVVPVGGGAEPHA